VIPDIHLIPILIVIAAVAALWLGVAATVLAACRAAAEGDRDMSELDDAVAIAGPMGWPISQAPSSKDVLDSAQEDLHIGPQRPVGDVQVVDRSHLA
jgi:hypothetical protein